MAEFVSLATWLREPLAAPVPLVVAEAPDTSADVEEVFPSEEDVLIDDVCARIRRFGAMLADAFDYVKERGAPTTPLAIRVHPVQVARAAGIGLPIVDDAQLRQEDAVIELRCGSIETRLHVPLAQLLATRDP